MAIEIKGTRNYSATVIRVPKVRKAENSDNLYIVDALGMTAIVDSSWIEREGELALIFPAEVQLMHDYCVYNNLYRDYTLNANAADSGYLETNRRVRAMKLRGNISNGLVMPVDSLGYLVDPSTTLTEGDVFDTFGGHEICRKYVIPVKQSNAQNRADSKLKKAFRRVDTTFLPEHFETGQWLREEGRIGPDEEVIVTQKLHGTSVRLANTIAKRQLKWYEKFAQKMGVAVSDHEYALVAGSKKVIKDPNNPNQNHYYKSDVWTEALSVYGDRIPKNVIVYGELIGFVPGTGTPIQKGHTYDVPSGQFELYVYRVAVITEDAELYDLSWDAVRDFCNRHGLQHVRELDRMPKAVFDVEDYNEEAFYDAQQSLKRAGADPYTDDPLKLSDGGTGVDEGIAIRVERGITPDIYKFKFKSFYMFESAELDTGEPDIESAG